MKRKILLPLFAVLMALLSGALFLAQYEIYDKPADTGFYFFQDLAFLPINVLLVTLGVNAFMGYRDKRDKLQKINILVSEFFIETGIEVIRLLNAFVINIDKISACAATGESCVPRDFKRFVRNMGKLDITVDAGRGSLASLRDALVEGKSGMLSMFENPNLFEHDRFTEMLWALYHLLDELRSRDRLDDLAPSDLMHLSDDIRRAYALLVTEWAYIIKYMKGRYPYLYSLAVRKNPFLNGEAVSVGNAETQRR
jgi:hypothetical protein